MLTVTIVTYMLLPEVILGLIAPMQCFKSIASEKLEPANELDPIDETIERMSIYPNEYCSGEFYQSLLVLSAAGFLVYAIVLPFLVLWRAAKTPTSSTARVPTKRSLPSRTTLLAPSMMSTRSCSSMDSCSLAW